jgi:hypothetical protein
LQLPAALLVDGPRGFAKLLGIARHIEAKPELLDSPELRSGQGPALSREGFRSRTRIGPIGLLLIGPRSEH